ncbi:MAG TPA: DNA repair protein RecN [Burkholderiaceae bacterium]|nr:DNA repair protein RecN [Burkholderiaceae bacterium]
MLLSLSIRSFVIVDSLDLDFASGFTVLSGETGAGKSILIDALLLALGERGDADVVREGAQRAEISAEFRPGEHVRSWLRENDLASDDGVLLARRTIDASGRSRSFVNGSAVTLAQLRELGESLIDVHGQHAHQSLLRPASQLQLLDEHGALTAQKRAVAEAFAAWKSALAAREEAEAMTATALVEQQRLRWIADELDVLAPKPGEWEEVSVEHKRLSHAAGLLEGARSAIDSLGDADTSALSQVATVHARLTQLAAYDERIAPIVELLDAAQIQLDEAVAALTRYLDKTDLDASRLAEVDARLSALHAASRKFKAAPEALTEIWQNAKDRLTALDAAGDIDALKAREISARNAYNKIAQELSAKRAKAAKQMSAEVTRAMQDLSMAGGRFDAQLTAAEPAAAGIDKVEFLVAGHAGVSPKALARVASGGELARISLAISVIAASATPVATLIFDEVDAGIGGAVADTVGRLLKQLGQNRQVLAVTHLPQVAAHGDHHYRVTKAVGADGRPMSLMISLDRKTRIEEIARMLGGQEITDTTRKHARELLAG